MFHLITGGSGSGKSAYAEDRVCQYRAEVQGNLFYIATMLPYGEETKQKIMRHRNMREDKGFQTIECYTGLKNLKQNECARGTDWDSAAEKCVLLECMSNLAANELYQEDGAGPNTVEEVMQGIKMLKNECRHLVAVTNEVCSESASDSEEMKAYRQILAEINCRLAEMADDVTEVVYGIPVRQKVSDSVWTEKINKGVPHMKLVIGGAYQGKLAYAEKKYGELQWLDGADCAFDEIYTCKGIFHFELYVQRMMKAGENLAGLAKSIAKQNPDIMIVTTEIGYGLVPVEAFDRDYREQVGRVCTELACLASNVDRVVCGIGMVLKGE